MQSLAAGSLIPRPFSHPQSLMACSIAGSQKLEGVGMWEQVAAGVCTDGGFQCTF